MSVRTSLWLLVGIALVMILLFGGIANYAIHLVAGKLEQSTQGSAIVRQQMEADMMHDALRADVYRALSVANDAAGLDEVRKDVKEHGDNFLAAMKTNAAAPLSQTALAALTDIQPKINAYIAGCQHVIDLVTAGEKDLAQALAAVNTLFSDLEEGMGKLSDTLEKDMTVIETASQRLVKTAEYGTILIAFLLIAGLTLYALYMLRIILIPLKEAILDTQRFAQGNLTQPVEINKASGELKALLSQLEIMRVQLAQLVKNIAFAGNSIDSHAGSMSTALLQITHAASEQSNTANHLAETVAGLTESIESATSMSEASLALVNDTDKLTVNSAEMMATAMGEFNQIVKTVEKTSTSIQSLATRSEEISAIVGVIKEIADQTNLLALNAAIEAARAGEQGRGFAVVADEVRKLAERTAQSTDEISKLIGGIDNNAQEAVLAMQQSKEQVDAGFVKSTQVAEALSTIREQVTTVTGSLQNMAESLQTQRSATQSMNSQVKHVSDESNSLLQAIQNLGTSATGLRQLTDDMRSSTNTLIVEVEDQAA